MCRHVIVFIDLHRPSADLSCTDTAATRASGARFPRPMRSSIPCGLGPESWHCRYRHARAAADLSRRRCPSRFSLRQSFQSDRGRLKRNGSASPSRPRIVVDRSGCGQRKYSGCQRSRTSIPTSEHTQSLDDGFFGAATEVGFDIRGNHARRESARNSHWTSSWHVQHGV